MHTRLLTRSRAATGSRLSRQPSPQTSPSKTEETTDYESLLSLSRSSSSSSSRELLLLVLLSLTHCISDRRIRRFCRCNSISVHQLRCRERLVGRRSPLPDDDPASRCLPFQSRRRRASDIITSARRMVLGVRGERVFSRPYDRHHHQRENVPHVRSNATIPAPLSVLLPRVCRR